MKRGAQGAVRSWLRQKAGGPPTGAATRTPVMENGRLTGTRTDAQRKKRSDADRRYRQRKAILDASGLTGEDAARIKDLAGSGLQAPVIARRLRIEEQTVHRVLDHYRGVRESKSEGHHNRQARKMHDIFTPGNDDGKESLEVAGITGGRLFVKPEGTWTANKPLLAVLPALRGLRCTKEQAADTVARVLETRRLAGGAEGVSVRQIERLRTRMHAVQDAITRFEAGDRSLQVETGRELVSCAHKLCGAAEETANAAGPDAGTPRPGKTDVLPQK